jgi:hypothetical protein
MYMLGCPLQAVYPMVPLADHHAVSVGMLTVHDQACIGVYADREALPDVRLLAKDIDEAVTELLAGTYRVMESGGSLLARVMAVPPEPLHEQRAPSPPPHDAPAPFRASPGREPLQRFDQLDYERELQRLASRPDRDSWREPEREREEEERRRLQEDQEKEREREEPFAIRAERISSTEPMPAAEPMPSPEPAEHPERFEPPLPGRGFSSPPDPERPSSRA